MQIKQQNYVFLFMTSHYWPNKMEGNTTNEWSVYSFDFKAYNNNHSENGKTKHTAMGNGFGISLRKVFNSCDFHVKYTVPTQAHRHTSINILLAQCMLCLRFSVKVMYW